MKENTIYEIMTHNKAISSKQKEKAQLLLHQKWVSLTKTW